MDKIFTLNDNIGFVSLVDRMLHDFPLKVVNSARISYSSYKEKFDNKDRNLCGYLWDNGHTSPYRHSFYTFHIKLPLFCFRQIVKYQVGSSWRKYEVDGDPVSVDIIDLMFDTDKGCSWNEVSGRYSKLMPEFYIPTIMRGNKSHGNKQASEDLPFNFDHEGARKRMFEECQESYKRYEERLEEGIAKEISRMMLPQNIYTQAYWTVSLQAVLHFLHQRLQPDAQYEIRSFAEGIYKLVKPDLAKMGITREQILDG